MDLSREAIAEFLGTLWLVLGGVGSAVLAANFMPETNLGIGLVGVSLAFGLTVVTGAYALGHISGGHFNPAVTLGILTAKRIEIRQAVIYVVAQLIGAVVATAIILIILGVTGREALTPFAPLAIGLSLTLIHLISIPVTNTSVNPARSTGPAIFVGGWALEQLWLFWVAPMLGAVLAGLVHSYVIEERAEAEVGHG